MFSLAFFIKIQLHGIALLPCITPVTNRRIHRQQAAAPQAPRAEVRGLATGQTGYAPEPMVASQDETEGILALPPMLEKQNVPKALKAGPARELYTCSPLLQKITFSFQTKISKTKALAIKKKTKQLSISITAQTFLQIC